METQNITLNLPIKVLRQIKALAAKRQTSVSRLLTEQLEGLIDRERGYSRARLRHRALLSQAPDLGTHGKISVKRDSLHER
jgi:hypothetical protein